MYNCMHLRGLRFAQAHVIISPGVESSSFGRQNCIEEDAEVNSSRTQPSSGEYAHHEVGRRRESDAEGMAELLTGRAFKLSRLDLQEISVSDDIRGGPWLTEPYHMSHFPFVTVQISTELSSWYVIDRPQLM